MIGGDKMGKVYGFPTANLDCTKKEVKFGSGVYAAWCHFKKKKYPCSMVVREDPVWKVEIYLIDYKGPDFYGDYLEIDPVQQVASIEKFESDRELIKKIKADINSVKELLSSVSAS